MSDAAIVVNAGFSSIKFAICAVGAMPGRLLRGLAVQMTTSNNLRRYRA